MPGPIACVRSSELLGAPLFDHNLCEPVWIVANGASPFRYVHNRREHRQIFQYVRRCIETVLALIHRACSLYWMPAISHLIIAAFQGLSFMLMFTLMDWRPRSDHARRHSYVDTGKAT